MSTGNARRLRRNASIKNALLAYFAFFALAPIGVAAFIYYLVSGAELSRSFTESRVSLLSNVTQSVVAAAADVEKIGRLVYSNPALMKLLSPGVDGTKPEYALVKGTMDTIADLIYFFNSDKYLAALAIVGENGLDLRYGPDSAYVDFDSIFGSAWFARGLQSNGPTFWPGLSSGAIQPSPGILVPVMRPIYDVDLGTRSGTILMLFWPTLFGSAYVVPDSGKEDYNLTVLGDEGQVIYSGPSARSSGDFAGESRRIVAGGRQFLQVRMRTDTGWTLIETAPLDFLERQRDTLLAGGVVVLLCLGAFVLGLGPYFSRRIATPMGRLLASVGEISRGNFDCEVEVGSNDEVGRLGDGIRIMQDKIKILLAEAIKREKSLKRAEIAALQAQINPHFIYNTLNAVRIMADMQGATGISDIVRSLGRMLRSAFAGKGEKITVEEEMGILRDYFCILKVRFKNAIRFEIDAEDGLARCRLLRFTLQPLVENAVFHGIEPKGGAGSVKVSFSGDGGRLVMRVCDDGVGMSAGQVQSLLDEGEGDRPPDDSAGFAVANLHRRIGIAYGEGYGLSYVSAPGEGTCVTVCLPREE